MSAFLDALEPFVWGFVIGFFWQPIWKLGKRIVEEVKLVREQWRQPRG
jgi:hypothetical protein